VLVILDLVIYIYMYVGRDRERERYVSGFERILLPIIRHVPFPLNFYLNRKEGVERRAHTLVGLLDT
jgi:hypothetical protein